MSGPQWGATDEGNLLELVAKGPLAPTTADEEWDRFVWSLRDLAFRFGGTIRPNDLRPLLRDRIAPKRIGAFTHRALSQGLVAYTGDWEISDDTEGRNGGKPARIMRWVGEAS